MKKAIKKIAIAFIIVFALSISVWATVGQVQKTLYYNNIKITMDGSILTPKDVNGNVVEPFIIDGTTYLPVRAISEALGLGVDWDGNTNTVILSTTGSATPTPTSQTSTKSEYHIGDTWTVPGQWSLTITGVKEMAERNPYSSQNPGAVYLVDFTYTNLGYQSTGWDGVYFSIDDTIVDAAGKMGYSYPNSPDKYAQETPIGATCDAQNVIAVDNPGTFRLTVTKYDGNDNRQSAVFVVDVK